MKSISFTDKGKELVITDIFNDIVYQQLFPYEERTVTVDGKEVRACVIKWMSKNGRFDVHIDDDFATLKAYFEANGYYEVKNRQNPEWASFALKGKNFVEATN